VQEKQVESQWIYRGKILDLKLDTVVLPDGKQTAREVVVHPGAAAVAALNDSGEVLLIRQFRYPAGEVLWELPAGKLERDEDPLECARRELAEETGYGAREWEHVSTFYTTPGFSDEIMYMYLARGLYQEKKSPDNDEFIEVHEMPLAKALELIRTGEIKDAKTIVGIFLAGQRTIKNGAVLKNI